MQPWCPVRIRGRCFHGNLNSIRIKRNRIVATLARDAFLPYAAPGSRSENLCKDIIRAGKQIFTFGDTANESLIAMGAKPIKVEDLKKQY